MSEYEPITAELRAALDVDREFMRADGTVVAQTFCADRGDFERCCDAIDAIHAGLERENAELRRQLDSLMYECRPMTDEHMAEHGWIRLPLDADGVPIRVGDVIVTTEWHKEVVEGILPERVLVLRDGEWFTIRADWCRHHEPTVEDVLREMADRCYADEDEPRDRDAIVAEYAKRLTLAGDAS